MYVCTYINIYIYYSGLATTDPQTEGLVSVEIVNIRTSLDYPVIADTLVEVIDSYMNMSSFIQSKVEHPVDVGKRNDAFFYNCVRTSFSFYDLLFQSILILILIFLFVFLPFSFLDCICIFIFD